MSGRKIDHLRISLTNRCNLDCFYCHKEGNGDSVSEMDTWQVRKVLEEARASGIMTIKFTGGEPLLRRDLYEIISHARELGFSDISLTTNGTLLDVHALELKKAGLERVNIGCDSLTGVLPKNIERLRNGILSAKDAGLGVKLNMVVLKGINDSEVFGMLGFCMGNGINLQLIELVECKNHDIFFCPLEDIERLLSSKADDMAIRDMQRRKRFFFGDVFVETVRPSREFCESCNKIRITADGRIRQCLMKDTGIIDFSGTDSILASVKTRHGYGYD